MKKIIIALFALAGLVLASCSDKGEEIKPTGNDKVEVSFHLGGDFIETSYTPMTRAESASKTYYGIEVQSCPVQDDDYYYYEDYYSHYSAGLFDNTDDMKISLERGKKYKFICYVVKEGGEKLYFDENGYSGTYPYSGLQVENKFSSNRSLDETFFRHTTLTLASKNNNSNLVYEPMVEGIYVGETTGYRPQTGGVIEISLKAMPKYAIKYNINPPSHGTITVTGPDFTKTLSADDEAYVETIPSRVFATQYSTYGYMNGIPYHILENYGGNEYYNQMYVYSIQDFPEEFYKESSISVTWERPTIPTKYYNKKIRIKSNSVTNININVTGEDLGESGFVINLPEEEEMGTTNQDILIESDVLVDETINPQY